MITRVSQKFRLDHALLKLSFFRNCSHQISMTRIENRTKSNLE